MPTLERASDGRIVLPTLMGDGQNFDELPWKPFREGVSIVRLYGDGTTGHSAALLRYAPGASVPRHEHTGIEQIFVLSGSQRDDHGTYLAGTCLISAPATRHAVASDDGCVVLATWHSPVRFLEGAELP